MKKKFNKIKNITIKEFENTHLIIDILFYAVFILIGYLLITFKELANYDVESYIPQIFYSLGFFSILAYFLNRRKDNYEFLMFGLINVITATYIVVNIYYDKSFILANAILLYTIAIAFNKIYHARLLYKDKNIFFIPKTVVLLFIIFLGICVMFLIPNRMMVANLLFGYYFIGFGLISLFEPLLCIIFNENSSEKQIRKLLNYEVEEKKVTLESVKPKSIKAKKAVETKEEVKKEIVKKTVVKKSSVKKPVTKKATTKTNKKKN